MTGADVVIGYLRELEVADSVSPEQGDAIALVINAHGGRSLFVELDERPGQFDHGYASGDWHWKMRQARNDRRNRFFDLI